MCRPGWSLQRGWVCVCVWGSFRSSIDGGRERRGLSGRIPPELSFEIGEAEIGCRL